VYARRNAFPRLLAAVAMAFAMPGAAPFVRADANVWIWMPGEKGLATGTLASAASGWAFAATADTGRRLTLTGCAGTMPSTDIDFRGCVIKGTDGQASTLSAIGDGAFSRAGEWNGANTLQRMVSVFLP